MTESGNDRERWGSRFGLILAAAGNAVGIGNLLRFPSLAGQYGGGAFLVPYLICLVLLGLPMMWVLWTIGRYGGMHGHGSTPGMLDRMWRNPIAKYLGAIGIGLPMVFVIYYTYVEGWCLAYSWFSLREDFASTAGRTVNLRSYLAEFQGVAPTTNYFGGFGVAFAFLAITIGLNVFVLWRGVSRGIELLAKIAMPLLFVFCVILAVRVFTLPPLKGSVNEGLAFLWTPDFSRIFDPNVWLAAAGQIFFTLSIGFGSMECYASYLREKDDIALTGLTTASTNEFVEVIFGSAIAIPAAAVFFGGAAVEPIAKSGTFNIGMVSMPEILRSMPNLPFYGTVWFLLLFFAAFTSSVAVAQPIVAFLQDEARWKRSSAAIAVGTLWIVGSTFVMFTDRYGTSAEMDFWAGTMGLVVFSLIEVVIFAWIFGIHRGWGELHRGADIRVPRGFKFVIRWVTPLILLAVTAGWTRNAIRDGTLVPKPAISIGVVGEEALEGQFAEGAVTAPEEIRASAAEVERRIVAAVKGAQKNLEAKGEFTFGANGEVRTAGSITASAELAEALAGDAFATWLEGAKGLRYEIGGKGASLDRPVRVRLAARFTDRMIRITRGIMAGLVLVSFIAVGILWARRRAESRVAG